MLLRIAILVGYVLLSLAGLYTMKRAEQIVSWSFAGGLSLYVAGFAVWLAILRLYPLSLAFPLAAGALIIGTQFVGWFLLGERLAPHRIVGVSLIVTGLATFFYFEPHT